MLGQATIGPGPGGWILIPIYKMATTPMTNASSYGDIYGKLKTVQLLCGWTYSYTNYRRMHELRQVGCIDTVHMGVMGS